MTQSSVTTNWWGEFAVAGGRKWRIGPLSLWLHRTPHDWRIAFEQSGDFQDDSLRIATTHEADPPESAEVLRFGTRDTSGKVELRPRLADRPVVVRPVDPFYLPADEEVMLYVSSPLWVEVRVSHPRQSLCDLPTYRPSDTWSGKTTTAGELCYALMTSARLDVTTLQRRPHRAFSAVRVRNRTGATFAVERLKVPAPNLGLFAAQNGQLWTETVTLELASQRERSEVRFDSGPVPVAEGAQRIGEPRQNDRRGLLWGAFDELLALGERGHERRAD